MGSGSTFKDILLQQGFVTEEELKKFERMSRETGQPLEKLLLSEAVIDEDELRELRLAAVLPGRNFLDILLDEGFISREQVAKFLQNFSTPPKDIGEILLKNLLITDEQYAQALAMHRGLKYVDLHGFEIDRTILNVINPSLIKKHRFIPLELTNRSLTIAFADPQDLALLDELKNLLYLDLKAGILIEPKICSFRTLNIFMEKLENISGNSGPVSLGQEKITSSFQNETWNQEMSSQADAVAAMESLDGDVPTYDLTQIAADVDLEYEGQAIEKKADVVLDGQEEDSGSPVVKFVNSILLKAIEDRASDIHFEAAENHLRVRYRVDGVLLDLQNMSSKLINPVVSRIKVMSELDIAKKNIPQDGRFRAKVAERKVDFRVSTLPSIHGETVVIRILDKGISKLSLLEVGLADMDMLKIKRNIVKPYGMILVTGPTGSGKTTSLYAMLNAVKSPEVKIITIEDPVEYELEGIVQVPVNEKMGMSFSRGLRSIVRQDPDKVLVGEIRDSETAEIAINAALTGHLVLSSIHANNVIDAVGRLMNMGIDPYEFVSSFNVILAQRLVRTICPMCKIVDREGLMEIAELTHDWQRYKDRAFYKGKGCRSCKFTGYAGRTGVFETLEMSDAIKDMILNRISPVQIKLRAKEEGMLSLREAGWKKVLVGVTTLQELNRVTFEEDFERGAAQALGS